MLLKHPKKKRFKILISKTQVPHSAKEIKLNEKRK